MLIFDSKAPREGAQADPGGQSSKKGVAEPAQHPGPGCSRHPLGCAGRLISVLARLTGPRICIVEDSRLGESPGLLSGIVAEAGNSSCYSDSVNALEAL